MALINQNDIISRQQRALNPQIGISNEGIVQAQRQQFPSILAMRQAQQQQVEQQRFNLEQEQFAQRQTRIRNRLDIASLGVSAFTNPYAIKGLGAVGKWIGSKYAAGAVQQSATTYGGNVAGVAGGVGSAIGTSLISSMAMPVMLGAVTYLALKKLNPGDEELTYQRIYGARSDRPTQGYLNRADRMGRTYRI